MSDQILQEWPSQQICVLRMNRPECYNALSQELVGAMRDIVKGLRESSAKVLVLSATGPGFCAGADLKERKTLSNAEKYAHNRAINALANEIAALPIPTIAAINGVALGGGCELSLACDIRFASSSASIGLTEARIGAMPGAGGSQRLPRLIGASRALEMMYSGEPISAEKAAEWGLVNAVAEPEDFDELVMAFSYRLASRSRSTTSLLKKTVRQGIEVGLADALELERLAITEVLVSKDYAEGLAAFAERREPKFS